MKIFLSLLLLAALASAGDKVLSQILYELTVYFIYFFLFHHHRSTAS